MKKRLYGILFTAALLLCMLPTMAFADDEVAINETNFPDEAFRTFVSTKYDKDHSGSLSDDELNVEVMNVNEKGIQSLHGIEYFKNLIDLACKSNQLTVLNVSQNMALEELNCSDNQLTALDVSQNTTLRHLDCSSNQLTALNVGQNTALYWLQCDSNALTALNVSRSTALRYLDCHDNELTALDVSQNTALESLECASNQLTDLNVSQNTMLNLLDCNSNQLTALDVSKNTALVVFNCDSNEMPVTISTDGTFDLRTLPGSFDVSKASDWIGATISGTTLTVKYPNLSGILVSYIYNCGNGWTARFALAHTHMMTKVEAIDATCTEVGNTEYYTCSVCSGCFADEAGTTDLGYSWIIAPKGHTLEAAAGKAATCTAEGNTEYYTCSACGKYFSDVAGKNEIEENSWVQAAAGHTPKVIPGTAATCTEPGLTEGSKCAVCGIVLAKQQEIPALGHSAVTDKAVSATCTEDSWTEGSHCGRCGATLKKQERVPALGHSAVTDKAVSATCTEDGWTEGSHCNRCGATLKKQERVPALGHSFTRYTYNNDAAAGVDGTETAACDRCGVTDTRTAAGTALPTVSFTDVAPSAYYADPVNWAVANEITNGTSASTFSPSKPCTRSQIVVFLWRAAGSPEPQSTDNPFEDVPSSGWYSKAVLWAVENGITTGASKTKFNPSGKCTRAQIVTFLWRAAGWQQPETTVNPFEDVPDSAYYKDAVLWAVENGITKGTTATKFAPNGICTRGQGVTFLYRAKDLLK